MPMDVNEASRRYSSGIDPYVSAYQDAAGADSSVEAQRIMENVRDQQLQKNEIVSRFEAGYTGDRR